MYGYIVTCNELTFRELLPVMITVVPNKFDRGGQNNQLRSIIDKQWHHAHPSLTAFVFRMN
jgi:hypothetical protein